ncbi:uncharacterized protein LOC128238834 isoform X2 [Mya arenaria]|uniref:uncharacterized protein LOC128238834 isoform X2 n=1 Tax=Mya arenaria TaxID=6604 RepID=UPI0022E5B8CD|nr:uncharacterized protein LOC128238834 isoform X2 [Mya arenaria]
MSLVFNGKSVELDESVFTRLKAFCHPIKINGTARLSEGAVPYYNRPIVICTRNKPLNTALSNTDVTTCLEQCVLHFAIVPQLAFYRDEDQISFISPFFRGGNLVKAKELSWKDRLRILYHIACAIDYLHNPPCDGRAPVAHGGICRKNIVLDEQNNARLLYYGPSGIGEACSTGDIEREKAKDWNDFKQVLQEMFSENNTSISSKLLDKLWILKPTWEIKANLTTILRETGSKRWLRQNTDDKRKCEICLVNEYEPFCNELKHDQCLPEIKIQMCVGCLWNWRYNPVKCHSCDQPKIQSPVGDGWGAILIAGSDPQIDRGFQGDIEQMKTQVITNPTSMGVRSENTVVVQKSDIPYMCQLKNAFEKIGDQDKCISTLVLMYSGHHGNGRFCLESDTYITDDELIMYINKLTNIEKVILFLDACCLETLHKSLKVKAIVQFNSVMSHQTASSSSQGSIFTKHIIRALTSVLDKITIGNDDLANYLSATGHVDKTSTNFTITKARYERIVAFRIHDMSIATKLKEELENSPLLDLKSKLIRYILTNFLTIPLNPIVQHLHSKLIDFYEPPIMTKTVQERNQDGNPPILQKPITEIKELFIFNECKDYKTPSYTKRVYISGEAGMGKTSFIQYLALAWCAVHGESEECVRMREKMKMFKLFSDIEYLKDTQLLFLLHLQKFEKESTCKGMLSTHLHEALGYSPEYAQKLITMIDRPNAVVLIDGLDEWRHSTNQLPELNDLYQTNVICSSRPCKIDSCVTSPRQTHNQITITGIGFESLERLIINATKCLSREGIQVRNDVNTFTDTLRPTIISLIASKSDEMRVAPFFILQILCLWHNRMDLGKTRTQMYENMSEMLILRMQEKQSEKCKITACNSQFPKTMKATCDIQQSEHIAKLSQLAFYLVFTGPTEHSLQFSEKDLSSMNVSENQNINDMFKEIEQFCLNSGILRGTVRKTSLGQEPIYSFIHKSYQEFFAAFHIVAHKCDTNICREITANTQTLQDVVELANVFDFVCGYDPRCIEAMVSLIDDLTTKHAIKTDDDRRIKLIKTIQNMIFDSCSKYVNTSKVTIKLSNLIVGDLDKVAVLTSEQPMTLLRSNRKQIKEHNWKITLNSKLCVLCVTHLSLSNDMDFSQFDMEELMLIEVGIQCVKLSEIQRLKRIALCLIEPTTVSIPFQVANNLTHLEMSNCSLSGPLDLSQCPLSELKLHKVNTKEVVTCCVETCTVMEMDCSFEFTKATNLTNLSMKECSLPGPLDLTQCPLVKLNLHKVQTKKVVTGRVNTCTVQNMDCLFEFMNATNLTNLSMIRCSHPGPLDISRCPLKKLMLFEIKTNNVVVSCVETCTVEHMDCSFKFTNASKLTNLSMKECSLQTPLDLSRCPLQELNLYKVQTQNVVTGCVKTCKVECMDCSFEFTNARKLTKLSMVSCSIPGQLDISQCPLEELDIMHMKTERMLIGHVEKFTAVYMSCLLDFTQANKLTQLTMYCCSLFGTPDLAGFQLEILKMYKCSLQSPLNQSQFPLLKPKLKVVRTEEVIIGCAENIEVLELNFPLKAHVRMSLLKASRLTRLSMTNCFLPGPLNLTQCPLKNLHLEMVETERVIVDCVENVEDLEFDFRSKTPVCTSLLHATKLTRLSMRECSFQGKLDLSQCPLNELFLELVETEMVMICCVKTCIFKNMSCAFQFQNANTLIDLRFNDCVLIQPVSLSNCPLQFLELVKVDISQFTLGSLETLSKLCISDCRFLSALPSSALSLVHVILKHCEVQNCIHYQPLTTLEIEETCRIMSFIELSKTSIKTLILHEPKMCPYVFEEQMWHIYCLPSQVKCSVSGVESYWDGIDMGKKLIEVIEMLKTGGQISVQKKKVLQRELTGWSFTIITRK